MRSYLNPFIEAIGMSKKVEEFYEKHYKKLMIIPILILIFSLGVLINNYYTKGEFIGRDVELKGGVDVTIDKPGIDILKVESLLLGNYEDYTVRELTDFSTHQNLGVNIKIGDLKEDDVKDLKLLLQDELEFNDEQFSPSITQAEFSSGFYQGLLLVVLFSFIMMAISVSIAFRTFIPSVAVISAAFLDIIFPLALLSLFGVKITGAGIVAFLLIIGYSIDTDVLLTTWMIKRKDGSYLERMVKSIKTGVTMTMTTIIVMIIGIVLSISPVLHQMFLIILIALITDLISTYLWNAPILIGYCKRKGIN